MFELTYFGEIIDSIGTFRHCFFGIKLNIKSNGVYVLCSYWRTAEGVTAWAWDPTTQYPLASIWRFVITIFFVSLIAFYLLRPFKVQYHNMFSYSVSIPSQHEHFLWMFLYDKFSCIGDLCFCAMVVLYELFWMFFPKKIGSWQSMWAFTLIHVAIANLALVRKDFWCCFII